MKAPDWTTVAVSALVAAMVSAGVVIATPRGGADVRDALLAHPEIIADAMAALRDRESGKAVAAERKAILTPFAGAWGGNPDGDLTIVEYYDYACGYCRASLPIIRQLLADDPKLKIVYRELPILSEESEAAARMSLAAAARGQAAFRRFHEALYAAGPLSAATIAGAARAAGFDPAAASTIKPRADAELAANLRIARALGMTGTPSWVIGDRVVSSMLSLDKLKEAVAAARAR